MITQTWAEEHAQIITEAYRSLFVEPGVYTLGDTTLRMVDGNITLETPAETLSYGMEIEEAVKQFTTIAHPPVSE